MRTSSVTRAGIGVSAALPLDPYTVGAAPGLYLKPGAGATCSVEITPDNVFDATVVPTWFPCNIAALTGATANASGALTQGARAARINQTVGGTTSTLQVVEQGII